MQLEKNSTTDSAETAEDPLVGNGKEDEDILKESKREFLIFEISKKYLTKLKPLKMPMTTKNSPTDNAACYS